jgi:uncharacterized NAD(P)/FAD-binding protein YdhS
MTSKRPNVVELDEIKKAKDYERFLIYELPTLEDTVAIELTFYSPERRTIEELRDIERKALDRLAYVHSKLPPEEAERFIKKCLPWWKVMRSLHKMIRDLAIEDLKEQGIEVPTKKQGAN